MKTPDEIKTGIEFCTTKVVSGNLKTCDLDCPYRVEGVWCRNALAHDTLAYIQQLEAKAPKWISVKDKMPPTGNAVLVAVHNQKMAWNCVEVDVWDGRWLENADSEWHIVTHWMPLPEPPEV